MQREFHGFQPRQNLTGWLEIASPRSVLWHFGPDDDGRLTWKSVQANKKRRLEAGVLQIYFFFSLRMAAICAAAAASSALALATSRSDC